MRPQLTASSVVGDPPPSATAVLFTAAHARPRPHLVRMGLVA